MYLGEHTLKQLLELLVLGPLVELADEVPPCLERVRGERQGRVAKVLFGGFASAVCGLGDCGGLKCLLWERGGGRGCLNMGTLFLTMLPAWSLKFIPLVFINL